MNQSKRLRRIGSVLVLLGVAVLGGLAGWWLQDEFGDPDIVVDRPLTVAAPTQTTGTLLVPDVVGLELSVARQVYLDAGVAPTRLSVERVPHVGTRGTVVRQVPPSAAELDSGDGVSVFVARPATMPDLEGLQLEDARDRLDELGVQPIVETAYEPGRSAGTVVRVTPPAGATATQVARIRVAESLTSTYLTDIEDQGTDCGQTTVQVAGQLLDPALACSDGLEDWQANEWQLDGRLVRLETVVGNADDSDPAARTRFRILVDGEVKWNRVLAFNESEVASVDISGAVQVRLESMPVGSRSGVAVWGQPRLYGPRTVVDALGGG